MNELTAQLERLLLRALLVEWHRLNNVHFKDRLKPPVFQLTEARSVLGRWYERTRTIEISKPLVITESWGVVIEVMKHEMAHQFVHEELNERDETAHGPVFRTVCARLGIDAAAAGTPTAPPEEDRIIGRIAKLLALAESPNEHEAAAAATMAQRLMLKYNLDRVGKGDSYTVRFLGKPSARVPEHERTLSGILAKHFFIHAIWIPVYRVLEGKRGSVLEISGTHDNVVMAEYVHGFLLHTAEELWREHRRALRERGNRERRTFMAGVMSGFSKKLKDDSIAHAQSDKLVWVGDAQLEAYARQRHPYIRNVRYTGRLRTDAFLDGQHAGRTIVMRKPVSEGPSGGVRLLPWKR